MNTTDKITSLENEVIRLTGLLRVSNAERNDAIADKRRLDYLEMMPTCKIERFCDQSSGIRFPWRIYRVNSAQHTRPSLREAIDASIAND